MTMTCHSHPPNVRAHLDDLEVQATEHIVNQNPEIKHTMSAFVERYQRKYLTMQTLACCHCSVEAQHALKLVSPQWTTVTYVA
jgi:hypothetical protein